MKRLTLLAILIVLSASPVSAVERGLRFVSVALHDIVDDRASLDPDAITTDRLIAFFEFLKGNGWTVISLDDVQQAATQNRPLPDRSILIALDDGFRSNYTRVFPLLLAYRIPAVMALVGSWMTEEKLSNRYITWDEAREMQRSGLVEFASHTYDLHRGIKGNPQGSELPAPAFFAYDPITGYEDEARYNLRVREDLDKSIALMKRELGKAPRALVWPYGRYTTAATEAAHEAGFTFALNLNSEPADASKPMSIPRYLVNQNFDFTGVVNDLRSINVLPSAQRVVRLNPDTLWAADARETDARLGRVIERVRRLGATSIVIDAALPTPDGSLSAAWFPNRYLPVRRDVLSRFAWQLQTRGGVDVYGRLPVKAALKTLKDPERVLAFFRDFGAAVPLDGLLLEDLPQLAAMKTERGAKSGSPWEVRERRDAVDYDALESSAALALRCFREVEGARPRLRLALLSNDQSIRGPSSIADTTLIASSDNPRQAARLLDALERANGSPELFPRRLGIWIQGPKPPKPADLVAVTRMFQRNGISVIGWDDDMIHDKPPAARVAGSVSASTFPVRF